MLQPKQGLLLLHIVCQQPPRSWLLSSWKFHDDDPWVIGEKMFNHLNDYLHPSSTKSALETAQALDALFPTHRSDEDQPEGEPRNHPRASSCIYGLLFLILQPRFVMTIRHKRSSLICWELSRAWYRRRQLLVSVAMMLSSGETCRIYIGRYGKSLIVSPSLMLSPDDN